MYVKKDSGMGLLSNSLNPKCYFEVGSNETLMKKYLFNNYDFDFMRSFELN